MLVWVALLGGCDDSRPRVGAEPGDDLGVDDVRLSDGAPTDGAIEAVDGAVEPAEGPSVVVLTRDDDDRYALYAVDPRDGTAQLWAEPLPLEADWRLEGVYTDATQARAIARYRTPPAEGLTAIRDANEGYLAAEAGGPWRLLTYSEDIAVVRIAPDLSRISVVERQRGEADVCPVNRIIDFDGALRVDHAIHSAQCSAQRAVVGFGPEGRYLVVEEHGELAIVLPDGTTGSLGVAASPGTAGDARFAPRLVALEPDHALVVVRYQGGETAEARWYGLDGRVVEEVELPVGSADEFIYGSLYVDGHLYVDGALSRLAPGDRTPVPAPFPGGVARPELPLRGQWVSASSELWPEVVDGAWVGLWASHLASTVDDGELVFEQMLESWRRRPDGGVDRTVFWRGSRLVAFVPTAPGRRFATYAVGGELMRFDRETAEVSPLLPGLRVESRRTGPPNWTGRGQSRSRAVIDTGLIVWPSF